MWTHYCPIEQTTMQVGEGEPCNWCGLYLDKIATDTYNYWCEKYEEGIASGRSGSEFGMRWMAYQIYLWGKEAVKRPIITTPPLS